MQRGHTGRCRAGAPWTFIQSSIRATSTVRSHRRSTHTAGHLGSHAPLPAVAPSSQASCPRTLPAPCTATWRMLFRLRLTPSYDSCSSGECCKFFLCLAISVLEWVICAGGLFALSILSASQSRVANPSLMRVRCDFGVLLLAMAKRCTALRFTRGVGFRGLSGCCARLRCAVEAQEMLAPRTMSSASFPTPAARTSLRSLIPPMRPHSLSYPSLCRALPMRVHAVLGLG